MDLKKIYNDGLEDRAYLSNAYNMTRFNDLHRELNKTQYMTDRKQKQTRIRELLKHTKQDEISGYVPDRIPRKTYKDLGFESYKDMTDYRANGMIYNNWTWTAYKRFLELENYILETLENADKLNNSDQFKAICFLVDQQYNFHTGIFDAPKADYVFCDEYNQFFYDVFQKKIFEIANLETPPVDLVIKNIVRKPLQWKSKKTSIGTLFGVLLKTGIIEGSKADIERGLTSMFDLNAGTMRNAIKLHENENEAKTYYDLETIKLTKEWIAYLEKSIPK